MTRSNRRSPRVEQCDKRVEDRLLSKLANVVPWEVDLATQRFCHVGPQAATLLGYPQEQWTEEGFWADRIHPEDREWAVAYCREAVSRLEDHEFEYRMLAADGRVVWIHQLCTMVPSDDGPARLCGIMMDITPRKRAEEVLRESEEKYRIIAETATDAIVKIGSDSRILFANPAVEAIFGYRPDELVGQPLSLLMPERLRPIHRAALQRYVETGERRIAWSGVELTGLHRSGREIPVAISFGERIRNGERRFTGIIRDITERKHYEQELRDLASTLEQRNAELMHAYRELEEFTSIASHDLQEPLRKLVSFSTLLREDVTEDLPEAAQRDLQFITDAARRMQKLVQDLLALSRAGKKAVRRERVAADLCVNRALEFLELRLRETGARIVRDALPEVIADPTLLTEIYQNLIGNALKFLSDRPPEIRLTGVERPKGWILGVQDNGLGVRAEDRERIFLPFRKLHGTGVYEGSGIGLAICRRAVERQGGRIWVESVPGQGSHFRFTLGA